MAYFVKRFSALAYFCLYGCLLLLSLLPLPVLYLLSDLVYFFLYYIAGYRKKVVLTNLRNAFPEKTSKEIHALSRRFYGYLSDQFLETFKTLSISRKDMLRHCKMNGEAAALFARFGAEGKSIILVMGHYGNWEWAGNTFSLESVQPLYVIYHPLTNKAFDKLMYNMRSRFGTRLIAMQDTFRAMVKVKHEVNVTAFIADQTPSAPQRAYWTSFMNQATPIFQGPEVIAKKLGYPIIYTSVQRVKRGYYEIFAEVLVENPAATAENEISEIHTRRLEKDIIAHPEIWLWSHRRWKYKQETILPS